MKIFHFKIIILILIILINYINKNIELKKALKYIDKCIKGINDNIKIKINNRNPKISVIIPVYNCEKTILKSISLIQHHNLYNFEIILINDLSKDNSKQIIERIKKKDPRILLINNNNNKGTFYSRNIGVLAAKGKYIFSLDDDDMFSVENIFSRIYNEAEKYNYDIIGFKAFYGYSYNPKIKEIYDDPFIKNKKNMVVYQPKLHFLSLINNDVHIWAKSIKNIIYKKAVNLLGKKRYSIYLCYSEDDVIIFILFIISKSFKFTNIYGLYHQISNQTASFTLSKNHVLFSKIFYLDILFDFAKNITFEKEYAISYGIENIKVFLSKIRLNNINRNYLSIVLILLYKIFL